MKVEQLRNAGSDSRSTLHPYHRTLLHIRWSKQREKNEGCTIGVAAGTDISGHNRNSHLLQFVWSLAQIVGAPPSSVHIIICGRVSPSCPLELHWFHCSSLSDWLTYLSVMEEIKCPLTFNIVYNIQLKRHTFPSSTHSQHTFIKAISLS